MMFKKQIKLFGLACLLLLSGCAKNMIGAPPQYAVKTPAQRQAQLAKVRSWRVDGEFSLQRTGYKPVIASYNWREINPVSYRINIDSALDLYQAEIIREFGIVKLWKNGSRVSTARSPEKLMQKVLGWSLPVTQLKYWMKGMPAKYAGPYHATYDMYGHLIGLTQKGWTLSFGRYKTNEDGVDFPRSITMRRPGFYVKIAAREWFWYMQPYRVPEIL
ncbi:MAG TPA: lipoprotein insertase outer membrane protein LolB [Coxiellaceae bacterium]|nr:MAG: outer membrane lipoprotein LolB [Gammaproteobacteria bacterium RIFCSPHIGHO2_12_FULL_36_30]HLB55975.1 lipoprotein insertase outer membrane protein LolB [Coxiellaceae bacterium]